MNKTFLLWMVCLLVLAPALAEAAPAGLEYLQITPASAPENPKPVIKLLEKMPGFRDAQWDAKAGLFTVMAEDSAHFEPRDLVTALQGEGVDVVRLTLHFEEVHAKNENSMGIIYSPPNRLSFPAIFTWGGQRFWGFWGNNPRGKNGAFRMDVDIHFGAVSADGKAAPDSVEIIRFELTKPYYRGQEKLTGEEIGVSFEAQLPSGNDPTHLVEARSLGWNWGGFLLPYWWLVGHGQPGIGFLLLVSFYIPFVGLFHFLLYPLTGIYLGLNGYELAWKHSPYHSVEQLRDRERAWSWWGLGGVILFMGFALILLAFWATLAATLREAIQGLPG